MGAKQITSDITWILEDNLLTRHPDFKVKTSKVKDGFRTTISEVNTALAIAALVPRAEGVPGMTVEARGDRTLIVTHPTDL